ncbi:acyl-CoA carboxylase subunit epsilon [Pseudarthrobacter sp. PS3-L1]|uniref:acyl-CoA carboxylase subunit epsilon n=1 Tax=Pseudarthrobacter sp. PS3-L1 TaxID=3046207 RepID=UPI0024B956D9|nr:acyl-CoA carboxylase subunit epsilon [Pseudarthrobacter sp. PS3-L1]MDJ0319695.1 acyl-CoA carboxylase subunit epsilon [Pseudarthrobacter sp. PS3-L1]
MSTGAAADPAGSAKVASDADAPAPLFSVVKGEPTPEDLAALTAVVLSLSGAAEAAPQRRSTGYWVRRQQLRLAPTPGPGAWRRSQG